ncbi:MAG: fluoride efflux transporter CrcB [Ginsengibacter sp.]
MFYQFLVIAAGGAIGSMLRYSVALTSLSKSFPTGTLVINIIGSFVIGILAAMFLKNAINATLWRLLAVGICGGFTTFSAFSLEAFNMLQHQFYTNFLLYIVASIAAGLLSVAAGFMLTTHFLK